MNENETRTKRVSYSIKKSEYELLERLSKQTRLSMVSCLMEGLKLLEKEVIKQNDKYVSLFEVDNVQPKK